jgi:hypothetical protein
MADLSKFGVPLNGENLGILHPKQQYRFRVIFNNFGNNTLSREMTQNVVSASRPQLSQEEVQLHAYNSVGKIAGKHTWADVEIILRDDINNSVVAAVGAQVQKQINHFEQTSAVAGINYKFMIEVQSLDGTTNEELERWDLDGCWIKDVKYAQGDYAASEPNDVTLTVAYDNATQVSGPNTNDGNTVGDDPMINLPSPTGGTTFG